MKREVDARAFNYFAETQYDMRSVDWEAGTQLIGPTKYSQCPYTMSHSASILHGNECTQELLFTCEPQHSPSLALQIFFGCCFSDIFTLIENM